MRKIVIIELAIIVLTLVIVLLLAFSIKGTSVTKYNQAIDWNNASRSIIFDLKTGQTVTGWFSLAYNETTGYIIYNQDFDEIIVQNTFGGRGDFTFTAAIDGQYYLSIHDESPWIKYIDYSYSIRQSLIFGIDAIVFAGIVIIIGVVLAATIADWDISRTRIKKGK
jgi:hypothetical protein